MSPAPADPAAAGGIDPAVAAGLEHFVAVRHDLHRHPELAFGEHRTREIVARSLAQWGYRVEAGVGGTGVVATLARGHGSRRLAIRADMDALPIAETTGLAYASATPGVMHACGHDGHTTILLAAAQALAARDDLDGTLHLVFQPAEETGSGAKRMIEDGLFDRFPADAIFGLHNWPGLAAGRLAFVEGPAMAGVDLALVTIRGQGGHGAAPHETVDPVLVSAHVVTALQSIVSRNVPPLDMGVVTVGSIHGGNAANVIPDTVDLKLTMRSFRPHVRQLLHRRVPELIHAQAQSFGAQAEVDYRLGFPPVINHAAETRLAREAGLSLLGPAGVEDDFAPRTASEDFSYFLDERPGSFLFVGNGDSAPLHNPSYNFNDAVIAPAASYWVRLAERFFS